MAARPSDPDLRHLAASARARLDELRAAAGLVHPSDPKLADWLETYAANHAERLAYDLELTDRCVRLGDPVLEIGSTPPLLTAALARAGHAVVGVDQAPDRFAGCIADLGLDVRRCDIEAEPLPAPDDSAACVLLNEVFEHLRINPPAVLAECLRVLRPGGLLMLSTPNMRGYRGIRSLVRKGRSAFLQPNIYDEYAKLEKLGHMGHVREYTPRDLRELLARVGFEPERVLYRGRAELPGEKLACALLPAARPFFTVLARKALFERSPGPIGAPPA